MNTVHMLGLLAVACVTGSKPGAPTTPTSLPGAPLPDPGPESAVDTYFRASDNGSSTLLRRAFHPATVMRWVDAEGRPQARSQLEWWMALDTDTSPGPRPADHRTFTILDREGPFALVHAAARWPTHRFDDFLLVVDTELGWRIAGKNFHRSPPGAEVAVDLPADDAAIRAVIEEKIAAHAHFDPARLFRSHLPDCLYVGVGVDDGRWQQRTLSEWAWIYAARRDAGEDGHATRWNILAVHVRGTAAAAKLEVLVGEKRYIDHLLLVRTAAGWRIAAATWGDPTFTPPHRDAGPALAISEHHAREEDDQEGPRAAPQGQPPVDRSR